MNRSAPNRFKTALYIWPPTLHIYRRPINAHRPAIWPNGSTIYINRPAINIGQPVLFSLAQPTSTIQKDSLFLLMATDWFLEEYKIVQSKIDEVLKSQFQVRSWSVTLLTAVVFGVLGTGRSPLWLIFALPIVAMFQLLDWRQKQFRKTLARRAMDLESSINLLSLPIRDFETSRVASWARLRDTVPALGAVPGVARILARENPRFRWIRVNAGVGFYLMQYAIISAVIALYLGRLVIDICRALARPVELLRLFYDMYS